MRTYYDILNVSPDSEDVVIRAAYRALIAKYHPDRFDGDPAEADRMSKLLNEAYQTLSNPSTRAAYDSELNRRRPRSDQPKSSESPPRSEVKSSSQPNPTSVATRQASKSHFSWIVPLAAILLFVGAIAGRNVPRSEARSAPESTEAKSAPPTIEIAPVASIGSTAVATDMEKYPLYRSTIPPRFRGAWDEIVSDKCAGREARFYLGDRDFTNFEVSWEVTKVKVYSPTEIDVHTTRYDENKNQEDAVWQFKLADGGESLTSRKPGGSFFKRCSAIS